jgi:hypothetical protein
MTWVRRRGVPDNVGPDTTEPDNVGPDTTMPDNMGPDIGVLDNKRKAMMVNFIMPFFCEAKLKIQRAPGDFF